jgi:hypothetical protein
VRNTKKRPWCSRDGEEREGREDGTGEKHVGDGRVALRRRETELIHAVYSQFTSSPVRGRRQRQSPPSSVSPAAVANGNARVRSDCQVLSLSSRAFFWSGGFFPGRGWEGRIRRDFYLSGPTEQCFTAWTVC